MKILRQNVLLKVLSLNSVSVLVSFVLGVFSAKIVSVFLGPPGMALLGSFRNFGTMLKSAGTLGINNSVVRLFVENKGDKRALSGIYSTFFWLFLGISVLLAVLVLISAEVLSVFLFYSDAYAMPLRYFGALLPLMALNAFWIAAYNGLEKYKRIIWMQIVSNVLVFVMTAWLIWQERLYGGLLALALGEALMFLVTFWYVRKDQTIFGFTLTKKIHRGYLNTIGKFSAMALLSAVLIPLTMILVRNQIVVTLGIGQAGIWDAVNRLSGFYMILFNSGLALYYMPKLASLQAEEEFKDELKSYFKTFIPLFVLMLVGVYLFRNLILNIAFTPEFTAVRELLIWQLLGDLAKMMTLAFGFQILVKTKIREYVVIEIVFNVSYLLLSVYLVPAHAVAGALQAYAIANATTLLTVLWLFRRLLYKKLN